MINYVSIEGLSKSYGVKTLFTDLNFGISQGQKIALIAKNGTGKTTLLKILSGKESPDQGQVTFRKGIRVGFLEQEPEIDPNLEVGEAIFSGSNPLFKLLRNYEAALENQTDSDELSRLMSEMDRLQAWDLESRSQETLSKLKLTKLKQKVGNLSGGQKRRLALAQLLLDTPDLLILDEPTNHLDLDMIEWLEVYLQQANITLFMVTHDRYFLDRVCNEILELEGTELYKYKGNYGYFLEKRQERLENEAATVHKAKNLMRKELDWMRRQPKARGTKSKARIDAFHDLKATASKKLGSEEIDLEINIERLGSKIIELHKVKKGYDDQVLFDGFTYNVKKGDRIGLVGPNGSGKSTLLGLITGKVEPDGGKVVIGDTVQFGYYTQKGLSFKEGARVIEVVKEIAEVIPLTKGRKITASQLLERFLFDKEKHYQHVSTLSGGEKKRLYLLTILMKNPNFLILDEPTNDLDIMTLQVLESFLDQYPGCLIIVSHDRFFMDRTIGELWAIEPSGNIKPYPGNYTDYLDAKELESKEETKHQEVPKPKKSEPKPRSVKLSYNDKKDFEELPKKIQKLEKEKEKIEAEFLKGDLPPDEIQVKSKRVQEVIDEIEEMEMRWLEISEKIDQQ